MTRESVHGSAGARGARAGDTRWVRDARSVLRTLDDEGRTGGLPFMPEMVSACGSPFRVARRLEKTCHDVPLMTMRSFSGDDVVILENLYCSGDGHGGCQKACATLWKLAWLGETCPPPSDPADLCALRERLRVRREDGSFLCQSSVLHEATRPLGIAKRLWKVFASCRYGNATASQAVASLVVPAFNKVRRKLHGEWPVGVLERTPSESLGLQTGDWVEVKSLPDIVATLDRQGKNRGLHFSSDMAAYCGQQFRVRHRLDRMITESDGIMRVLKDTVILESVTCRCPYTFGGCPRGLFQFWREIWLRRV